MKRSRGSIGCLLLWALATAVSHAAGAVPAVTVDVPAAKIVRRTFDLRHPPADLPKLKPPEVGACQFEFACDMESRIEARETEQKALTAKIVAVKIMVSLSITIWTPLNAPAKIIAHEEAHREICETYYRPAAALARQLGEQALRTPLAITGPDKPAAIQSALRKVQDGLIATYTRDISARCAFAQERFDAITDHSRKPISESDGIRQAIEEEAENYRRTKAKSGPR